MSDIVQQYRAFIGRVVDATSGAGVGSARVEMTRGGLNGDARTATTDADGYFSMPIPAGATGPEELGFQCFLGTTRLTQTPRRAADGQGTVNEPLLLRVDLHSCATVRVEDLTSGGETLTSGRSIRGTIRGRNGGYDGVSEALLVEGYWVRGSEPGGPAGELVPLQYMQQTSTATAGPSGGTRSYILAYDAPADPKRVLVKVRRASGAQELVGASDVLHAPKAHSRVDIVLDHDDFAGSSEYTDIIATLVGAGYDLQSPSWAYTLSRDGLLMVAADVGIEMARVSAFVAAARLSVALPAWSTWSPERAEYLYAIVRSGILPAFDAILQRTHDALVAAIDRSADQGVIRVSAKSGAGAFVSDLHSSSRDLAFSADTAQVRGSWGPLLAYAIGGGETAEAKRAFINLLRTSAHDSDSFWSQMYSWPLSPYRSELMRCVELAAVCAGYLPFIIEATNAHAGITARGLVDISDAQLDAIIIAHSNATPPVPIGVQGSSAESRRLTYRQLIRAQLELHYPAAVVRRALLDDPQAEQSVKDFLTSASDFDFDRTPPHWYSYLESYEAARPHLLEIGRLYRLAPPRGRYATIAQLRAAGLTSASRIARMSFATFQSRAWGLSWEVREPVYRKAYAQAALADAMLTRHHPGLRKTKVQAIRDMRSPAQEGDWGVLQYASLFGPLETCACDSCRSVLSPAAYLYELMGWVSVNFPPPPAQGGQQMPSLDHAWSLEHRRPDLASLELSCANVSEALPYIDLLNEVLEDRVAGSQTFAHNRTSGTLDERLASPEHVLHTAYVAVAASHRASDLPFHRPLAEQRVFLEHLGVARRALMAALQHVHPGSQALTPTANALAAEQLGLSALAFDLIASGADPTDPRERWALTSAEALSEDWNAHVCWVRDEFLPRARLTREALPDLLFARAVNPILSGHDPALSHRKYVVDPVATGGAQGGTIDPCDDGTYRIQGHPSIRASDEDAIPWPTPSDLTTMDRFLRLQRATGWAMIALDRVIDRLGLSFSGSDDAAHLRTVAAVHGLAQALGAPVEELLPLWAPLDTWAQRGGPDDSAYARLFSRRELDELRPAPGELADPAWPWPFELNEARTELVVHADPEENEETLARHHVSLRAALGASPSEWAELVEVVGGLGGGTDRTLVCRENLSQLHRRLWLARKVGVTPARLQQAIAVVDIDPFASPAACTEFLAAFARLSRSPLAADAFAYVAAQADGWSGAPSRDRLGELAQKLATALRPLVEAGEDEPVMLSALRAELAGLLDVDTALAAWLCQLEFPSAYSTDPPGATATYNLGGELRLLDPAFILSTTRDNDDTTGTPWSLALASLELMLKVVTVARALGASAEELAALVAVTASASSESSRPLELLSLPCAWTGEAHSGSLGARRGRWLQTVDIFEARRKLQREGSWAAVISHLHGVNDSALVAALVAATRAPEADIAWLVASVGREGAGVSGAGLLRIHQALAMAARLDVPVTTLWSWVSAEPTPVVSSEVVALARAGHADARLWAEVARPLRDTLRERQRDALVSQLLHQPPPTEFEQVPGYPRARTADDLYAFLLIDPSMSACALTTRIRQAACSVQLFVHRALAATDPVQVSDRKHAMQQWSWLKTYRVWEAAKKVYLWPENWISPDLRDDKTPLFETFENAIQQAASDDTAIETAVVGYVQALDDLANLEPVAVFHEQELWQTPKRDVLHLLARTRATPMRYFYRSCEAKVGWTPWEKLDGEPPQEHAILVTVENRLLLVWAVIAAEQEAPQTKGGKARHLMRVRLAWTERTPQGWTPVQTPEASYATVASTSKPDPMTLHLRVESTWGELRVGLYQTRGTSDLDLGTFPLIGRITIPQSPHRVRLATFVFDAASMVPREIDETQANAILDLPDGAAPFGQRFIFGSRGQQVVGTTIDESRQASTKAKVSVPVFKAAQGAFTLLPPAVPATFVSGSPFLITGPRQSWLVRPSPAAQAAPDKLAKPNSPIHVNRNYLVPDMHVTVELRSEVTFSAATMNSTKAGTGRGGMTPKDEADKSSWYHEHAAAAQQEPTASSARDTLFHLEPLYHPHSSTFLGQARRLGLRGGLLGITEMGMNQQLYRQQAHDGGWGVQQYQPATTVQRPYPRAEIDFSQLGAYSQYNWELFLHAPMRIAQVLGQEFQYERAIAWLETVFQPTPRPPTWPSPTWDPRDEMWLVKPLAESPDTPLWDWSMTAGGSTDEQVQRNVRSYMEQVAAWRSRPFNPYAMARLRGGTFQRAVVMQYLDTLIAWADDLFRRDTIEALNEAANLYLRAAKILGPRPLGLGSCEQTPVQSLGELGSGEYSDSDVLRGIEERLHGMEGLDDLGNEGLLPALAPSSYFSVPHNPKLMAYWDTLADRFFKLRHCRNLEGVERQLPLWDPPIDPMNLVRAAGAGVDIADVVSNQNTAPSNYRFTHVLQRAYAFTGSVRALGGSLLSALEKKDTEAVVALRAQHEVDVLTRTREIRLTQVNEAREQRDSARQAKRAAEARLTHFSRLLATGVISDEKKQLDKLKAARVISTVANGLLVGAGPVEVFPNLSAGVLGIVPFASAESGGTKLASVLGYGAQAANVVANHLSSQANTHGIKAGHARREEEWKHAQKQAEFEVAQTERQEAAAELRLALAQRELANHDQMVANATEVKEYLEAKFTKTELYDWMVRELQTTYRQSFNLAFQMAKQAEACFGREHGHDNPSFVRLEAWDSQRMGLLAGERLQADLERMEAAYLKEDRREFELTKQLSLAALDGRALVKLIEEGETSFQVKECWFDLDFPGHYFRRIQAVTVSMPTVSGQQAGVHAEVSLTKHAVRTSTAMTYDELGWPGTQTKEQIATSSGQDDAGLFTLDYRDPRYLPFERRGAVSEWEVAFVEPFPTFDRRALADVSLNMRYTARQGEATLRGPAGAPTTLVSRLGTLTRAFYCSRAFGDQWKLFTEPTDEATGTSMVLPLSADHFPAPFRGKVQIAKVELLLVSGTLAEPLVMTVTLQGEGQQPTDDVSVGSTTEFGLPSGETEGVSGALAPLTLSVADKEHVTGIEDLIVILHYEVSAT